MKHTRAQLTRSLARLGLQSGDVVMMRASVRAVGPVFGGPDEIHLAVSDAVGPSGTMAMVAACQRGNDDIGRGIFTPEEEAAILAHQPAFDPATARADREVGTLAEFFRSYPGTRCSPSTARLAARGARAEWLTADAHWTYPFGPGSPYEKLCRANGKVLLLGSRHDEVTLLHYAEQIADFPDKIVVKFRVPVMRKGRRIWIDCEEFDSSHGAHARWPHNFFELIVDDFIARHRGTKLCSEGTVGDAPSVLLDAQALVHHAIPIMIGQARGEEPLAP